jgi:elongation factor G
MCTRSNPVGPGQFAEVVLRIETLPRGEGVRFESEVTGGAIPREYIPSVEDGVRRAARAGVLAGYPVVDVLVVLEDGSFHERDSSTLAFELAGSAAFAQAQRAALPVMLEPVMAVQVTTPLDYVGDCIGDLNRRRAMVRPARPSWQCCGNPRHGAVAEPVWLHRQFACSDFRACQLFDAV